MLKRGVVDRKNKRICCAEFEMTSAFRRRALVATLSSGFSKISSTYITILKLPMTTPGSNDNRSIDAVVRVFGSAIEKTVLTKDTVAFVDH